MNSKVIIADLPPAIRGFSVQEADFVTIVLNARLNHETQLKAYEHEIDHMRHDDFQKTDAQAVETAAHKIRG